MEILERKTFIPAQTFKILLSYRGVSLNGGTPKTPQNDHFYSEKPWLLGTTILGNPHIAITIIDYSCYSSRN